MPRSSLTAPPLSKPPPPPTFHAREDFDHQSTVEPGEERRENTVDLELSVDALVEIPRTGSTRSRAAEDSGQILLEPSRGGDALTPVVGGPVGVGAGARMAHGTGETMDEPTMAEDDLPQPQLAVVRAPPAHAPPPGGRPGSRMGSSGESAPVTAWLTVQAGTDRGRRFAVKNGRTSIGRGIDNDVVLTDIAVSRRHLTIDSDPQGYIMTDLGSGNGTLVNDRDQDGTYRLGHGDRLELGNTVLVFECQDLAPRAQSVPGAPRSPAVPAPGKQKWARHDDDDQSTVAGKKPVGLKLTAPMPAPKAPTMLGAPTQQRGGQTKPPQARRSPTVPPPLPGNRRTATGQAVDPPSMHSMPRTPSVPHGALPTRDPQPAMPVAGAHMPTMAADMLGLGGMTHATPQPPMHQMPPMGSGFSPFPGAGLSYPSPPAGFGIGGPTPHPPPRFQYPQGVMSPSPGSDRKRVLIGILAIAFVAVGAGIIMALVHGRGDEKTATTDTPATPLAAPTPAVTPAPVPTPTPTPVVTPGQPAPGGTPTAGALPAASDKVTLASLMGEKDLTADAFGNDEQFLSDVPSGSGAPPPEETDAPTPTKQAKPTPEKRTEKRPAPERSTKATRREPEEEEEEEEADEPEEDSRPSSGDEVDVDAAVTKAEKQYKSKQFAEAAATLRRAADGGAGKKEAQRLRATAKSYESVGNYLRQGTDESDSTKALSALKKAHSADANLEGALDTFIGVKIGNVAPNAAKTYMARSKFAEAKSAADDAQAFGNGAAVASVRSSLDTRATEIYDRANAAAADGDDAKAADLARQAMKLVPKSSPIYTKAAKLAAKK